MQFKTIVQTHERRGNRRERMSCEVSGAFTSRRNFIVDATYNKDEFRNYNVGVVRANPAGNLVEVKCRGTVDSRVHKTADRQGRYVGMRVVLPQRSGIWTHVSYNRLDSDIPANSGCRTVWG